MCASKRWNRRFQAGEGGGIVFGALENNADEAADVIAQLFGADVNPYRLCRTGQTIQRQPGYYSCARRKDETGGHHYWRIENAAVQIVDLIIFHIFFLWSLTVLTILALYFVID
jgi:hypothetical protein